MGGGLQSSPRERSSKEFIKNTIMINKYFVGDTLVLCKYLIAVKVLPTNFSSGFPAVITIVVT